MQKSILFIFLISVFLNSCTTQTRPESSEVTKPNIVYILADDLGWGDLSCYGQTHFQTPNIDQLAESGMQFTQHYAGCTVCAPSRSSLMTGQTTGHTFIRGNKEWKPEGQYPMQADAITMAEALKNDGYVTGAFGKWGLGYPGSEGDPNMQGFDEFFGYNCQRMGHNYYPYHLWHNQEKVILEGNAGKQTKEYAPEVIHKQALKFLDDNKDKPFFMYYPSIIPHAELFATEEYIAKFRGKFDPEKNFKGVDDGDNYKVGGYGSQPEAHAAFAAMVDYLDMQVGEIIAKLKELGVYDNTLIIFTSDNGPHMEGGADPDFFNSNGPFKGYKRDLYEGGIRVPMIAVWGNKIKAGSKSDHISAFWDVFPTVGELTGAEVPENIDGISFLPTLLGKDQKEHDYLYWEFHEMGGRKALRQGDWKLIHYNVNHPEKMTTELYNLASDPGEENNVAADHPEVVQELEALMENARTPSEVFPFQK
ncbi:arylsulfatase [Maribellus sp. YY47]|uniref:arylsulfatase n=1 Tax=Maribellus sp. YY47 TaxID=2929486 RepID=UPI002000629E|nr:arylsulfatase [Maribellus sp. YY47]MCK3683709.1 arylsulfatase [Maribellus sp. YY47]